MITAGLPSGLPSVHPFLTSAISIQAKLSSPHRYRQLRTHPTQGSPRAGDDGSCSMTRRKADGMGFFFGGGEAKAPPTAARFPAGGGGGPSRPAVPPPTSHSGPEFHGEAGRGGPGLASTSMAAARAAHRAPVSDGSDPASDRGPAAFHYRPRGGRGVAAAAGGGEKQAERAGRHGNRGGAAEGGRD